ncbi:MAG: Zn-dependent protease [Myxococcota bacterium]|jgi:Zn-dependent protease
MYGEQSFQFIKLFGNSVQTNVEGILIMLVTGLYAGSWLEGCLVVASFTLGTGLHLGCHWLVAITYGKGIDRMVLTRAGRIDYTGVQPTFGEGVLRTLAGPTANAVCAAASYAMLAGDVERFHPTVVLALSIFGGCNLILAAINFLPAIPFDGGLVLQQVVSRRWGEERGLAVAVWTSMALLAGMMGLGVWLFQPVLVYLALTIGYDNWRKHLRSPLAGEG